MNVKPSKWWWLILLAYAGSGLALGLGDPALGQVAQQLGVKPGVGTAVTVNALLPLAAVVLGLAHARLASVWVGALAMTLGLIAGLVFWYPPAVVDWSPVGLLGSVPPVLYAAFLGYGVLGTVAVLTTRAWRARVAL
jgi:hypothetical protein